jgi:hypothetical protein
MEDNSNPSDLAEVGLIEETGQEGCLTVTCDSFGEGIEYVGFMMQTVGATILAIVILIVFYVVQQNMKRRRERRM